MTITHCRPGRARTRPSCSRPAPGCAGLARPDPAGTDGENAEQESSERHQERELITAYREQASGGR